MHRGGRWCFRCSHGFRCVSLTVFSLLEACTVQRGVRLGWAARFVVVGAYGGDELRFRWRRRESNRALPPSPSPSTDTSAASRPLFQGKPSPLPVSLLSHRAVPFLALAFHTFFLLVNRGDRLRVSMADCHNYAWRCTAQSDLFSFPIFVIGWWSFVGWSTEGRFASGRIGERY